MIYILLIILVIAVAGIIAGQKKASKTKAIKADLQTQGYNVADDLLLWKTHVALNTNARAMAITEIQTGRRVVLPFDQIRDCEILKDGETVYKKSAGRTVGGALVGGVLLGGVGAIIGGLSGGSKGKEKINSATLKIYTNNIDNPSILINIFDKTIPVSMRKPYIQAAERMADKLAIIVDGNTGK